jgi:hypothetical protein
LKYNLNITTLIVFLALSSPSFAFTCPEGSSFQSQRTDRPPGVFIDAGGYQGKLLCTSQGVGGPIEWSSVEVSGFGTIIKCNYLSGNFGQCEITTEPGKWITKGSSWIIGRCTLRVRRGDRGNCEFTSNGVP